MNRPGHGKCIPNKFSHRSTGQYTLVINLGSKLTKSIVLLVYQIVKQFGTE